MNVTVLDIIKGVDIDIANNNSKKIIHTCVYTNYFIFNVSLLWNTLFKHSEFESLKNVYYLNQHFAILTKDMTNTCFIAIE